MRLVMQKIINTLIHLQLYATYNSSKHILQMEATTGLDKQLRADFDKLNKRAAYGTAGFRDLAINMSYISFRAGALVALINKTQPNKHLGIVMSASHNKREDNGLKITNFRGNMLEKEYEPKVEEFVNEPDFTVAVEKFKAYLKEKGLTFYDTETTVLIGGDTRPSTEELLGLVTKGLESQGARAINFGLTTTPQLQAYVYLSNVENKKKIVDPEQIRSVFWHKFSGHFTRAASYLKWQGVRGRTVDCANGVGAVALPEFAALCKDYLNINTINTVDHQFLNKDCGADYVKTNKLFPRTFTKQEHGCYLSFDGDADRIVFYTETDGKLNLIDGDREGTVLTEFFKRTSAQLRERTEKLNQSNTVHLNVPTDPSIGFVQTYYANYSSSEYLKNTFGMDPLFAATGVKNLHQKAEHYDIGIYFEANGHGTVIFKDDYLEKLDALLSSKTALLESPPIQESAQLKAELEEYFNYLNFYIDACKLSNPSVGDAICVFLLFELALHYLKIEYQDTLKLYTDLESLTSKIAVKTKENLKVTKIEDKVVEPAHLQASIQAVLEKYKGKKAFLRASGTEDVLRLHVEAATREQVNTITEEIRAIVQQTKELN